MCADANEQHQTDIPKMLGMIGRVAPGLIIRMLPLLFRFKSQAKKGARIFYEELLSEGIDSDIADKLTAEYLSGSNMVQLFRLFGSQKD